MSSLHRPLPCLHPAAKTFERALNGCGDDAFIDFLRVRRLRASAATPRPCLQAVVERGSSKPSQRCCPVNCHRRSAALDPTRKRPRPALPALPCPALPFSAACGGSRTGA